MKRQAFLSAALATTALAPLAAKAFSGISGTWQCTASGEGQDRSHVGRFTLRLERHGARVRGSYYDSASLEGTLNGNVLTGTFHESSSSGNFRFIFADDGSSFEGHWNIGSNGGAWVGERAE